MLLSSWTISCRYTPDRIRQILLFLIGHFTRGNYRDLGIHSLWLNGLSTWLRSRGQHPPDLGTLFMKIMMFSIDYICTRMYILLGEPMRVVVEIAGWYHRHFLADIKMLFLALQIYFVFGLDAFVASSPAHFHYAGKGNFQKYPLDL